MAGEFNDLPLPGHVTDCQDITRESSQPEQQYRSGWMLSEYVNLFLHVVR